MVFLGRGVWVLWGQRAAGWKGRGCWVGGTARSGHRAGDGVWGHWAGGWELSTTNPITSLRQHLSGAWAGVFGVPPSSRALSPRGRAAQGCRSIHQASHLQPEQMGLSCSSPKPPRVWGGFAPRAMLCSAAGGRARRSLSPHCPQGQEFPGPCLPNRGMQTFILGRLQGNIRGEV